MQILHQLILGYQKLNYVRWYNQEGLKNIIKQLAKNALIPLGSAAAADAGIHKKILVSGKRPLYLVLPKQNNATTIIMSNDDMEDIINIVK